MNAADPLTFEAEAAPLGYFFGSLPLAMSYIMQLFLALFLPSLSFKLGSRAGEDDISRHLAAMDATDAARVWAQSKHTALLDLQNRPKLAANASGAATVAGLESSTELARVGRMNRMNQSMPAVTYNKVGSGDWNKVGRKGAVKGAAAAAVGSSLAMIATAAINGDLSMDAMLNLCL